MFFGLGLITSTWARKIDRRVFALPNTGSGMRWPVNWVNRERTW